MKAVYEGEEVNIVIGEGTPLPAAVDVSAALAALRAIAAQENDDRDVEADHMKGDTILCDILNALGLTDVVEAYRDFGKWWA